MSGNLRASLPAYSSVDQSNTMPAPGSVICALVTLLLLALKVVAAPGDLDRSFQSSRGASSSVQTIVEQPDGKLIIGGDFTAVDDIARNRIARLNPDGTLDRRFLSGLSGASGQVRIAVPQSDGKILIGGAFHTVNRAARRMIARLNPDGTLDTGFLNGLAGVGSGTTFGVYSIALQPDGKVLVGGDIKIVNGALRGGIARLHPDGSLDPTFMDGMTGADATVRTVVPLQDGKILIGGSFKTVNGVDRKGIARLNSDGSLDGGLQADITGTSYQIQSIAVQDDGKLVIGGLTLSIGGTDKGGLARLNSDGSEDTGFRIGATAYEARIGVLAMQPDGRILAAGLLLSRGYGIIERFNSDGTRDSTFRSSTFEQGAGSVPSVQSIKLRNDGTAFVGGSFTEVVFGGGITRQPCNRILRLLSDGQVDATFVTAQTGTDYSVATIATQAGDKILTGGYFTKINAEFRGSLMRLHSDGTPDRSFRLDPLGSTTAALTILQPGGDKILIGGYLSFVQGEAHRSVVRLDRDGTLDSGFLNAPSVGALPTASMTIQTDGKVLIAGNDSSSTPTPFSLFRLNNDGTMDTSFVNGLQGLANKIWCVAALADGKMLVGGESGQAGGVAMLKRLNSDGTIDPSFPGTVTGSSVRALVVQNDGMILLAGNFSRVNGIGRANVARIKSDGTLDTGFLSGQSGTNGIVYSMALQEDGKVLLGGTFTLVNGNVRNQIARLNSTGALDAGFYNGMSGVSIPFGVPGPGPPVQTMVVQSDGRVLIGGRFDKVNGVSRGNIARLLGDAPDIAVEQPAGSEILHDGGTAVSFGPVEPSGTGSLTFTLRNSGNLNLTGLIITKVSGNALNDFTVPSTGADSLMPNASTTFTVGFDPQAPGLRTVLLEIASNDPDEAPFLLRLTGNRASTLDLWRRQSFGTFSNSGTSGDLSDHDGDGTVNILEFGTGTNPLARSLPAWHLIDGGGQLEFIYTRPSTGTEALRYDVEWCDAPSGPWLTVGQGSVQSDDGTLQQVKASIPSSPAGRRFVRLRVTPLS